MGELSVGQALPGACAREGNGERGFAATGRRDTMERGGWHWPCNLDHSWSREGGGSMAGALGMEMVREDGRSEGERKWVQVGAW